MVFPTPALVHTSTTNLSSRKYPILSSVLLKFSIHEEFWRNQNPNRVLKITKLVIYHVTLTLVPSSWWVTSWNNVTLESNNVYTFQCLFLCWTATQACPSNPGNSSSIRWSLLGRYVTAKMERTLYLYNTSRLYLDSFFQCSYFDNLRQMEKEYFNALSLDKKKSNSTHLGCPLRQ